MNGFQCFLDGNITDRSSSHFLQLLKADFENKPSNPFNQLLFLTMNQSTAMLNF